MTGGHTYFCASVILNDAVSYFIDIAVPQHAASATRCLIKMIHWLPTDDCSRHEFFVYTTQTQRCILLASRGFMQSVVITLLPFAARRPRRFGRRALP